MAGSCNEGRDWGFGIWDRKTRSAGDPASPCLDASGMSEKTTASGGVLAMVAASPAVALLLQGGDALGAYQCGVYQGLPEAGLHHNRSDEPRVGQGCVRPCGSRWVPTP